MTEQSASVKLQLQPFDLSKGVEVGSTSFFVGEFGYYFATVTESYYIVILSPSCKVECQIKKVLLEVL